MIKPAVHFVARVISIHHKVENANITVILLHDLIFQVVNEVFKGHIDK